MRSAGLNALVADAAVLATEAQLHLVELHSGGQWSVDLTAGTFTFSGPDPGTYRVQLLGSSSASAGTWLWGWANPADFPEPVLRAGNATRELGERYRIDELSSGTVPFGETPEGAEPGEELSFSLSLAARIASGLWFHYRGPVGGGTVVWMLLEGLTLPPPSLPRTVRALTEAITAVEVADHRRAVSSYATLRGIPHDGSRLELPDGVLTVEFDDHDRIVRLSGTAGPAA